MLPVQGSEKKSLTVHCTKPRVNYHITTKFYTVSLCVHRFFVILRTLSFQESVQTTLIRMSKSSFPHLVSIWRFEWCCMLWILNTGATDKIIRLISLVLSKIRLWNYEWLEIWQNSCQFTFKINFHEKVCNQFEH